jgi:O-6-methylguanine DNA methyltransferase
MSRLQACIVPSEFGEFIVAWEPSSFPRVRTIHLPTTPAERKKLLATYELVKERPPLVAAMARHLAGEAVRYAWRDFDWTGVPAFHLDVYRALLQVPRGRTVSYAGLARAAGRPHAARAVGQAMARNPLPLVVPCHRVVATNGHLNGFGGGLELKRRLLLLEGVPFADKLHVENTADD